jgi:glycosyltransferase involved in cell wall biosynthesis
MKIAIMHYHLRPGGVTTVVKQQAAALSPSEELLLLTGEPPASDFGVPVAVVPGIAYDRVRPSRTPEETAAEIAAQLTERFGARSGPPCDVLHVHNPTLKKNSAFLKILELLREQGIRLFLHIHDLAEDGRPHTYFAEEPYPEDFHYAVINSRDYRALAAAGLKQEGLHLLFNVVTPLEGLDRSAPRTRVVYPVRAIRRKNVGEAVFLSLFLPEGLTLALTLPPSSERDVPSYQAWKRLAGSLGLPVEFEVGLREPFAAVMSGARAALTTSLKEGFGFSFLEPWTAGIPVAGRRLEAVCPDFEAEGVSLPRLYGQLRIPLTLVDTDAFYCVWAEAVRARAAAFGRAADEAALAGEFGRLTAEGWVDFGVLDGERQAALCSAAARDPGLRGEIAAANPMLDVLFDPPGEEEIERNRRTVRERYSLSRYREALLAAYRAAVEAPVAHRVDKRALLDRFLEPGNFRFASTEVSP